MSSLAITPFEVATASAAQWAALADLRNSIQAEYAPADPPESPALVKSMYDNAPAYLEARRWVAWDGAAMAACGEALIWNTADSANLAEYGLRVAPPWRRQGLGRALLERIAEVAEQAGRPQLLTTCYEAIPAGIAFQKRIGGQLSQVEHKNRLRVAELDHQLLACWREAPAGFALTLLTGPYPDALLPDVITVYNAAADMPHGDLAVEQEEWTPQQIREEEASLMARGKIRWTMLAHDIATGAVAGYSELHYHPLRPEFLFQQGTVVLREYRGRGVGKWLKAAMLTHALSEQPQVKVVQTGNADSNEAMLHINEAMGFRLSLAVGFWQAPLASVRQYLNG